MKTRLFITATILLLSYGSYAQNRDSSNAVLQRAIVAKQERRMQLAMNLFEQAVKWDTSNVEALKSMGEWGIESRNYRQAVEAFTRWHNLEPNNELSLSKTIRVMSQIGAELDNSELTKSLD